MSNMLLKFVYLSLFLSEDFMFDAPPQKKRIHKEEDRVFAEALFLVLDAQSTD